MCAVINAVVIIYHLLENTIQPPEDKPDLYKVINNALCLVFFSIMLVYVHSKMVEEVRRYEDQIKNCNKKKTDNESIMPDFVKLAMDSAKPKQVT